MGMGWCRAGLTGRMLCWLQGDRGGTWRTEIQFQVKLPQGWLFLCCYLIFFLKDVGMEAVSWALLIGGLRGLLVKMLQVFCLKQAGDGRVSSQHTQVLQSCSWGWCNVLKAV